MVRNTEKVFTAINKDGKEILIFRKDRDTYINLNSETNEIIPKENIDLTSLSLISNSIDLRKYMLKYCIKRKYKKDREKLIETKKNLIGLKVVVDNYQNWYTGSGIFNKVKHHRWEEIPKDYDLYAFVNKKEISYNTMLDVYNNLNKEEFLGFSKNDEPEQLYKMPNFKNGKQYIITENNLFDLTKESYLSKKTINEIGYKLRKNL